MEYNKAVRNSSPWNEQSSLQSFLEDILDIPKDDGEHPLLNDESPGFSASVIQRSLVTWMHLGKKEGFSKICKYYYSLEKLEESYSPLQKAQSRQLELENINKIPDTSEYFLQHWGHIYGLISTEQPVVESKLDKIWETGQVSQATRLQLQNIPPSLCTAHWR